MNTTLKERFFNGNALFYALQHKIMLPTTPKRQILLKNAKKFACFKKKW